MNNLELKQENFKLELYRSFSRLLVTSMILCFGFSIYHMRNLATDELEAQSHWPYLWFLEGGFWNLQYTLCLCGIMYLWRPSPNSLNYAYSMQLSADENEDHEGNNDNGTQDLEMALPMEEDDEDGENLHIIADEYGADDLDHEVRPVKMSFKHNHNEEWELPKN